MNNTQTTIWRFWNDQNDNKNLNRKKCEIYTRVMWYYRPVSFFNEWKKSEFFSRTCFDENLSLNSKFSKQYSNKKAT